MESEQDILRIHSDFAVEFQGKKFIDYGRQPHEMKFLSLPANLCCKNEFFCLFVCLFLHQLCATGIARYCDFQPGLSCDVSLV